MAQTPRHERKPLVDVTPAPVPRPASRPSCSRSLQRAQSGLFLQRFTLKSRRSAPYPEVAVRPGAAAVKPPNRLLRSGELPVALVKLCSCSWDCKLEVSRPRLPCRLDTDEHDEYRLLEAMSRRFAAERAAQGDMAEPDVARSAADQKLQVHFILEPIQEVAVGYIALRNAGVGTKQFLHQVYVEPECRRMGFATTALRLILAKASAVGLASRLPLASLLMERVGFTDVRAGAQEIHADADDADVGWIDFYRAPPLNGQWEDRWNSE